MASDLVSTYLLIAVTEEAFISLKSRFFNTRGDRQGFGGGSRLIGIADTEISPQVIQKFRFFFLRHRGNLIFRKVRRQIRGLIQIEAVTGRHSQHFSRIRLHYDTCDILRPDRGVEIGDVFFHDLLCGGVYRGYPVSYTHLDVYKRQAIAFS